MKTKIFYFTGTGNSLSVARDIGNELEDAELVSIPGVVNGNIESDDPAVGIVFPVYMWGMPNMVVDFIQKLKISRDQYIFAVATCAGQPGESLVQLKKCYKRRIQIYMQGLRLGKLLIQFRKTIFLLKLPC